MFEEKTVIILGAGASKHYGYPTGEELITDIIKFLINQIIEDQSGISHKDELYNIANSIMVDANKDEYWNNNGFAFRNISDVFNEFRSLGNVLSTTGFLNIDTFIRYNKRYEKILKVIISYFLLKSEDTGVIQQDNNWIKFFLNKLIIGCTTDDKGCIVESKINQSIENVDIITFNYDMSFEFFIADFLARVEAIKGQASDLMNKLEEKIHHVYGKIYNFNYENLGCLPAAKSSLNRYGEYNTNYNIQKICQEAVNCSKNLHVIGGDKQQSLYNQMELYRKKVHNAKKIIILGYGFDDENNHLVGINPFMSPTGYEEFMRNINLIHSNFLFQYFPKMHITNYKRSMRIERKFLSDLFYESEKHFASRVIWSHRKVSDALYCDFDF